MTSFQRCHWVMYMKTLIALQSLFFMLIYSEYSTEPKCPPKCNCSKNLKMVNCEKLGLFDIPANIPTSATELFLGYNKLTTIKKSSFSTLKNLTNLSLLNNRISDLQDLSFSGLENLRTLTLRKNRLQNISHDAFQGLRSLHKLYLTDNYLTDVPDLSSLPNLTLLTLDTNNLQSANLCKGSANLSSLSTIVLSNNANLTRIVSSDFKCVSRMSIRAIDVSRCNLQELDKEVFSFKHLQSLKLSYNKNISYDLLRAIFQSVSESDLTSLDLANACQPAQKFPVDIFKHLSSVKLKHLSLAHTEVNIILNGTFQYLPYLEYIDFSYSSFIYIEDQTFSLMSNLTRIALQHNSKLGSVPKFNISSLLDLDLSYNLQINTLENYVFLGLKHLATLSLKGCGIRGIQRRAFNGLVSLKYLDLSRNNNAFSISGKALSVMQNLERLDLSYNKFVAIPTEYDIFRGLGKLRWLDLSNNDCGNVSIKIFQPLVNLQMLNLTQNLLGRIIDTDSKGQLFQGLDQLKSLHLDSNNIKVIPNLLFKDLESLQLLNLSNNHISSWQKQAFNASRDLKVIDFASNKIGTITEVELLTIPEQTRLNLSSNPFACDCDLIWFRRWIQTHNSSWTKLTNLQFYTCNSPDRMAKKLLLDFNPDDIETSCYPWPILNIILITIGGLLITVLFVFGLVYRYRWSLRLRLYYVKRHLSRRHAGNINTNDDFEYDILVSYGPSERDRDWVKMELIPRIDRKAVDGTETNNTNNEQQINDVENSDEQRLVIQNGVEIDTTLDSIGNIAPVPLGTWDVFFEERDAPFNLPEFDTLAEAIYNSRKIILVISNEYLGDDRRRVEIEWVIKSRCQKGMSLSTIIVVFLDPGMDVRMPATLHGIIQEESHLEWVWEDPDCQELFWRKLSEALQADIVTPLVDNV